MAMIISSSQVRAAGFKLKEVFHTPSCGKVFHTLLVSLRSASKLRKLQAQGNTKCFFEEVLKHLLELEYTCLSLKTWRHFLKEVSSDWYMVPRVVFP